MRKVEIDADLLTPKDIKRARVALGGRDPWELLRGEQEDRAVLVAWCQLSRDDPTLTFEQLEDLPFGDFVQTEDEEPDPQMTPGPISNGSSPGTSSVDGSRPELGSVEPDSAAASTSA